MNHDQTPDDDAPGRTAKHEDFGGFKVGGRTVTINAPLEGVLRQLHDLPTLNLIFGGKLEARALSNGNLAWHVDGDAEGIETLSVKHRAPEVLSWRSLDTADTDLEIKLLLRDSPASRGTEVQLLLAWKPRWGTLGSLYARLRGFDPILLGRQALKRLKMLIETGEIATAENRRVT